jgi:hypothetical protein
VEDLLSGIQPVMGGLHQHGEISFAVSGADMLKEPPDPAR